MITAIDVPYLEAVETEGFYPLGWLYGSVYESLRERGLVRLSDVGFVLTSAGKESLAEFRMSGAAGCTGP